MLTALVIAAILSIQLASVDLGVVEKCIKSAYHKKFPSPEPSGFVTCFPYQKKSCCWPNITVELKANGVKKLNNFDWDYCGKISEKCRDILLRDECFFQCDPTLIKWVTADENLRDVPICSNTCHEWFEACKDDKTYVKDWLEEYIRLNVKKEPVKPDAVCRTFTEIYGNGEELCNTIWGSVFKYDTSSNCVVF